MYTTTGNTRVRLHTDSINLTVITEQQQQQLTPLPHFWHANTLSHTHIHTHKHSLSYTYTHTHTRSFLESSITFFDSRVRTTIVPVAATTECTPHFRKLCCLSLSLSLPPTHSLTVSFSESLSLPLSHSLSLSLSHTYTYTPKHTQTHSFGRG